MPVRIATRKAPVSDRPPRVRMAPSPTGALHVGSVRTALYNFLYARRHGGAFILRIEDTDEARATDEAMRSVLEALRWVGLDWDEGPEVGGGYGPYVQSLRRAFHQAVTRRLEAAGHAYRCYCTADELAQRRQAAQAAGRPPIYDGRCRDLEAGQRERLAAEGRESAVRVRTPNRGEVVVDDRVRGQVSFEWSTIGDFVVLRADGSPTYPLANAADDVAQGITVVCRGEDLLPVTPRQLLLYGMLEEGGLLDGALQEAGLPARQEGWAPPASFAHLPMIVGDDRKPLSKRHGSVAVQDFARRGYLPEVLVNYLALLGWAPGDGRERMTLDEMIAAFSFEQVGRAAAAFDEDKLTAFNGEGIRALPPDELADRLLPFLDGTYGPALVDDPPTAGQRAVLEGLVPLVQERMQRLDEIRRYAPPFFREKIDLDPASVDKVLARPGAAEALEGAAERLARLDRWTEEAIEEALRGLVSELDSSARKVFQPVRVAVSGSSVSPPLFESLALMPRARVLERIRAAVPVAREGAA